jgi:hypothetical protein
MKMDKRYQVFVSSTYSDLKEERKDVMQTLLEMDCFPQEWNCSQQPMKNNGSV